MFIAICVQCGDPIECETSQAANLKKYCKLCHRIRHQKQTREARKKQTYRDQKQLEQTSWKADQPPGKRHYYESGFDPRLDRTPPRDALQQLLRCFAQEQGVPFRPINMSTLLRSNPDMMWLFN